MICLLYFDGGEQEGIGLPDPHPYRIKIPVPAKFLENPRPPLGVPIFYPAKEFVCIGVCDGTAIYLEEKQ